MQPFNPTSGLAVQVVKLTWIDVGTFNLVKYIVLTYAVGVLWSSAHLRLIETKRYLSLWYTGQFSVGRWGRSRNNLFSGSNFETLWPALCRYFAFSKEREPEGEVQSGAEGRVSLQCLLFEIVSIGLIILIACAEATSEVYTDNVEYTTFKLDQRMSPVRRNSSDIFIDGSKNYSEIPEIVFARRCTKYKEGKPFVSRPNLIVERILKYPWSSDIFFYDLARMCLRDENDPDSQTEVIHTLLDSQTNTSALNGTQDYSTLRLKTKKYRVKYGDFLPVPLFYNGTMENLEAWQRSLLLLVELDGNDFTCTRVWCVRLEGEAYEVVFLVDRLFRSLASWHETPFNASRVRELVDLMDWREGVLPFQIHRSSVRLLDQDRFMRIPPVAGLVQTAGDMENVIHMLAVGYTYGWATTEHRNQSVITGKRTKIVPAVQVGYFVSLCVILSCSVFVLLLHFIASRKRKITGLVGEHVFIDRWHGYQCRDGLGDRVQRRTTMTVFRSLQGVGRLQPPIGIHSSPLSDVSVMAGGRVG